MYKKQSLWWLYTAVFLGIIALDRISKWLAVTVLGGRQVSLFPGLNFTLMWNRGVSWGLFNRSSYLGLYFLALFIAIVIVFFLVYTIHEYRRGTMILFELLVLAGALSNFFDRIYYGAVVDFIDIYVSTGVWSWHWPTFNVADACIVVGMGGILVKGLLCERTKI
ncbi:signal peptidase II [Candidatus Dependentiae bacterium]|nr:signal peptidase II [Candidatus Dependentiae bacterium]